MSDFYNDSIRDFAKGMRVELHPATDAWMQGDRYGEVTRLHPASTKLVNASRGLVRVRMDKSGRSLLVDPRNLRQLEA